MSDVLELILVILFKLYLVSGLAIGIAVLVSYQRKHKRDCKLLFALRDTLNMRFEETGSPARYSCSYGEWGGVEDYDLDPAEEAIKFLKESLEKYDDFLASGGDPKTINDVQALWSLECIQKNQKNLHKELIP